MNYERFQDSEFFSFFVLHEIKRSPNELTRIILEPGGFREYIYIELKIDDDNNIKFGTLELDRSWVGNELNIDPFAKDICKSFINELTIGETNDLIEDLIKGLWDLKGKNDKVIYNNPPMYLENHKSEIKEVVKVYMGI